MPLTLQIRIEFHRAAFHGRTEDGESEWPPSPLRLFQALVGACAAHWNERGGLHTGVPALRWLESLPAPQIAATPARTAQPYRLYVPSNTADLVAKSWVRGNENSIAKYRTEKDVHPRVPTDPDNDRLVVHYQWILPDSSERRDGHIEILSNASTAITHLGWGVDQVMASVTASEQELTHPDELERWDPVEGTTDCPLRIPVPGTFDALVSRYKKFLTRLDTDFFPVPPLTTARTAFYRNERETESRKVFAFALRPLDTTRNAGNFRAYDTTREGVVVAAMIRHFLTDPAVHSVLGWPSDELPFLHGHSSELQSDHQHVEGARVAILPLPSLEFRGERRGTEVGSIRRVLLTVLNGSQDQHLEEIGRLLSGRSLVAEGEEISDTILAPIPRDRTIRQFTGKSSIWSTVTPVVLPGFDDPRGLRRRLRCQTEKTLSKQEKEKLVLRLTRRTEKLLRKAILHAGFSSALAENAELEWSSTGYWPGTTHAKRYFVPEHLQKFPRYHVRVRWRDSEGNPAAVNGPVCIGGGRFYGAGLFAIADR